MVEWNAQCELLTMVAWRNGHVFSGGPCACKRAFLGLVVSADNVRPRP